MYTLNTTPIYHIRLFAKRCAVTVHINGARRIRLTGPHATFIAPPLNPYLIGKKNTLVFTIKPSESPPYATTLGDGPSVLGDVAVFSNGEEVLPTRGGSRVVQFNFADLLHENADKADLVTRIQFDNEGPTFVDTLLLAPVINNRQRELLDYAMTLHRHAAERRVDEFVQNCAVHVRDVAIAYGGDPHGELNEFSADIKRIVESTLAPLDRHDIRLVPHCCGRLVELARWSGEPLIFGTEHIDSAPIQVGFRPIVGDVSGRLLVVR